VVRRGREGGCAIRLVRICCTAYTAFFFQESAREGGQGGRGPSLEGATGHLRARRSTWEQSCTDATDKLVKAAAAERQDGDGDGARMEPDPTSDPTAAAGPATGQAPPHADGPAAAATAAAPAPSAQATPAAAEDLAHLRVLHGKTPYDIVFDQNAPLRKLKEHLEQLCEVPATNQKLTGIKRTLP